MDERKTVTAADIAKIREQFHECGYDGPPVRKLNPACGCMCGTVYDLASGEPIISRYGRNGPRCTHSDDRGRLLYADGDGGKAGSQ